ncbi:MAG: glucose-6-phosphate isomerase [Bacteriovoracaceae bacterium]
MNSIQFKYSSERKVADLNALKHFEKIINDPKIGFFHWTEDNTVLHEVEQTYLKFKHKKLFVHIGIGGSSLGPEMLVSALKKNHDVRFVFINNIDSDEIHDQLNGLNAKDALFYVVSKSGTTAETMAALSIVMNWGQFKNSEMKDHFVFCTDPHSGDLRQMAKDLSISCLTVPSSIGGRFSALTSVGLFPASFAGISNKDLFTGAERMKKILLEKNELNPMLTTAEMLLELKATGVSQTVLMPYSSKLRNLSFWFVQLWAESLGKKKNKSGQVVNTGLTPIPSYGATDQHSQVQLFMEGPNDKCFFIVKVKHPKNNYQLACDLNYPSLKNLSNVHLNQLMEAELIGTVKALQEAERPFVILEIEHNNEESLGAMILFFESLTALMGYHLNIDPFDQPGVEAGKKYAWEHIKGS